MEGRWKVGSPAHPGTPPRSWGPTLPLLRQHYAPSVFEKYTASVTVGNKEVTLNLYDTAGECACAPRVGAARGFPARASPLHPASPAASSARP